MALRSSLVVVLSLSLLTSIVLACGGGDTDSEGIATAPTQEPPTSTPTVIVNTSTPIPTSTTEPAPTAVPTATAIPTATSTPQPSPTSVPTSTPVPTPTPVPVPTNTPTPTVVPTATPTQGPPTPIPTATPIGYSYFTGNGTVETTVFDSPPRLPWVIEWVAEGTGPNSIVVLLMDPDSNSDLIEIVNDSGTGQIGGANLVLGNMGRFYLLVEGPDAGWEIWIKQQ